MRVLVLGSAGMAGHVMALGLKERGFEVVTHSRSRRLDESSHLVDVTDKRTFETFLDSVEVDAVINCVGVLIQHSEDRKDLATYVNSHLPHLLAHKFANTSTRIIHLSTDCVFSGKSGPYRESSPPDGELFYDRTKALGELENDKDVTFRMSIVGPDLDSDGVGLFNWFAQAEGEVRGYSNVLWNGITTIELARAVAQAIAKPVTGIYHLTPQEAVSKYELLQHFKLVFPTKEINITPVTVKPVDKSLQNTRTDFAFDVRGYPEMMDDMRSWINSHHFLYPHYRI